MWKVFTLLYLVIYTNQWAMQGHSIIARIAEKKLEKETPLILKKVYEILSSVDLKMPETPNSLLEPAALVDVLNFQYNNFMMYSHFSNTPIIYSKDKITDVSVPNAPFPETVLVAINRAAQTLKTSIENPNILIIKEGFMNSLMLRLLVHLTGDIHQPLHNATMFAKNLFNGTIINGDEGGNKIPVNDIFDKNITNLHTLWDDAFNAFDYKKLEFPYTDELKKEIESQADYLINQFPESYFNKLSQNLDFSAWAAESFDIAQNFVYQSIELFPMMGPEYIINGKRICLERMTLAGYRLANVFKKLFEKKQKSLLE